MIDFLKSLPCLTNKDIQSIHNQFKIYEQIVLEFGYKFNLISHSDLEIFTVRHIYDSLMLVNIFPQLFHNKYKNVIDIGTGAGLPGIPLAIIFPNLNFTLLDSNKKKCTFLENFVKPRLSLNNVSVVCSRAESLALNDKYSNLYDLAISRAAANIPILIEWSLPLVRKDGICVFWVSNKDWIEKYSEINFFKKHQVNLYKEGNYKLNIPINKCVYDMKIVLFSKSVRDQK